MLSASLLLMLKLIQAHQKLPHDQHSSRAQGHLLKGELLYS